MHSQLCSLQRSKQKLTKKNYRMASWKKIRKTVQWHVKEVYSAWWEAFVKNIHSKPGVKVRMSHVWWIKRCQQAIKLKRTWLNRRVNATTFGANINFSFAVHAQLASSCTFTDIDNSSCLVHQPLQSIYSVISLSSHSGSVITTSHLDHPGFYYCQDRFHLLVATGTASRQKLTQCSRNQSSFGQRQATCQQRCTDMFFFASVI